MTNNYKKTGPYQNLESMAQNKPVKSPPYHSSDALKELEKMEFHEISEESQKQIDAFLGRKEEEK